MILAREPASIVQRRRSYGLLLLFSTVAVLGCGRSSMPKSVARTEPATRDATGVRAASAPPGEEIPSLEALAARGPAQVPSMREVQRSAEAAKPTDLQAGSTDACFRAVVAASAPIRAWFEDRAHVARGAELAGLSGLVPPQGPACIRKGEALRLVVLPATPTTTARAVVWRAP